MPIVQSRIMTLVNAAIEYRNLSNMVAKWLSDRDRFQSMTRDQITAQLQDWASQIDYATIELDAKYTDHIGKEHRHFRTNARRNERSRVKAQIQRREQGITPRGQPRSFGETEHLIITDELVRSTSPDTIPSEPFSPHHFQTSAEEDTYLREQIRRAKLGQQMPAENSDEYAAMMAEIKADPLANKDQPLQFLNQEEDDGEDSI